MSFLRRLFAVVLLAIGVVCLSVAGLELVERWLFQQEQDEALLGALTNPHGKGAWRAPELHHLVGRLEIPSVQLSAIVAEGDDRATLRKAVGHLPETALPWEPGNTVLAGHRDTFFRHLGRVRPGDEIRLVSTRGTLTYRVRDTEITTATDMDVLAQGTGSELTLLTCYPISYVGPAPQRYIVRADRVAPMPPD